MVRALWVLVGLCAVASAAPRDHGIYSELDDRVDAALPQSSPGTSTSVPADDLDGDGIANQLDILRGAKKLVLNAAAYHEAYRSLSYPGGDVPRTEGVCTDTIVRALRNAGLDLQRAVHEDIAASPASYPMVKKADANIDHRRVKTLRVWFRRHARALPVGEDLEPGDVLFLDTFPSRDGPEHVGIVSDRMGAGKKPLVVNNWTDGWTDAELDLLGTIAVTDHYRIDGARLAAPPRSRPPPPPPRRPSSARPRSPG